jgi:hypothetical protein
MNLETVYVVLCSSIRYPSPSMILCSTRSDCCSMFHLRSTNVITVPNSSVHSWNTNTSMPQVHPFMYASCHHLRKLPSCVEQHPLSLASYKLTRCPLSLATSELISLFFYNGLAYNPYTTTSSDDLPSSNRLTSCVSSYCRYPRAVPLVTCVLPRPSTAFLNTSVGRTINEDT